MKAGGRNPESHQDSWPSCSKKPGNKKEAAAVLERLNFIYPMDSRAHQQLGALLLDQGNAAGAVREFHAVVANKPIDPGAGALRPGARVSC